MVRQAKANRPVWLSILAISWFWAVGATLLAEFPTIARENLAAGGHVVTLMLAFFSIGIGFGSVICAQILRGEISAPAGTVCRHGDLDFHRRFCLYHLFSGCTAQCAGDFWQLAGSADANGSITSVGLRRGLFRAALCNLPEGIRGFTQVADNCCEQCFECGCDDNRSDFYGGVICVVSIRTRNFADDSGAKRFCRDLDIQRAQRF